MTHEYKDIEIRRVINQAEEEQAFKEQDIYAGVIINDREYEFNARCFFDESLKIHIPTTFIEMPMELIKLKYPSSDRPQIILTDTNGAIDISFSLLPSDIDDSQIAEVKTGMKTMFQKLNPAYLFFEEGIEMVDEKTIGFFEFKSPTLTEPLFNVMFYVEIERNIMMGCFNCPYDEHLVWQPLVRQMLQSIRIGKKVEQHQAKPESMRPVQKTGGGRR